MTASSLSAPSSTPIKPTAAKNPQPIKLLLVDFRNGEPVRVHPDVAPLLNDGWSIRSAVPRIVEDEGTRLFVVLTRRQQASTHPLAMAKSSNLPTAPAAQGSRPKNTVRVVPRG